MRMRVEPARAFETALVVEDDDVIAQLMRLLLEADGYEVSCASDRASIEAYLTDGTPPQLITLDWKLRDLSGVTALRSIRSTPDWENVPVLVVTGLPPNQRDLAQALATYDYVDCLGKPFTMHELYRAIRRVSGDDSAAVWRPARRRATSPQIAEGYSCQL